MSWINFHRDIFKPGDGLFHWWGLNTTEKLSGDFLRWSKEVGGSWGPRQLPGRRQKFEDAWCEVMMLAGEVIDE